MTKEELRKAYQQKRSLLSDPEYLKLNTQLCQTFFECVDLSGAQILHTFLPIEKNREPDTRQIITQLGREFPKIRVSIPKVTSGELESFFFDTSLQFKENNWGIPEPVNGILTDPKKIDMVLVPMLTFDKRGHRVGYGKGFYDKFLSATRKDCKRVGLCLFEPVEQIENINDLDVPLTQCITPGKSYTF
jgi:5-formyltetrahydrofolate cyclo-ligase